MPDNTYPPRSNNHGALASPRKLHKWLDVSPQGGALKRVKSYVELPTFTRTVDWLGYSEIILAWNYTAPNNFVFTNLRSLPSNPNYILCIAYQRDGIVYRYKLAGNGGTFYFDLVPYVKQPILKNFRFEIWSKEDASVSEATGAQLHTSVRGNFDYRFADDSKLVDNGDALTDFQALLNVGPVTTGLQFWFSKSYNLTVNGTEVTQWNDAWTGLESVITGSAVTYPESDAVQIAYPSQVDADVPVTYHAILDFMFTEDTSVGVVLKLAAPGNDMVLTKNINNTLTWAEENGNSLTTGVLTKNVRYFIQLGSGGTIRMFVTGETLATVYFGEIAGSFLNGAATLQLGDSASTADNVFLIANILGYTNANTFVGTMLQWLVSNINPTSSLPLTFPTNTAVPNNE